MTNSKIAVFTDIHFQEDTNAFGVDADERLADGFAHVQKHVSGLDHLVICGDLAHKGEVPSYELLKTRLEMLEVPYTLMIGNHDNRENFQSVFPDAPRDENGFVQSVLDMPSHRLIFIDTLNAPPYDYPEYHAGFLCEKRLKWLSDQLEEAGPRNCILFMHHHPHDVNFVAMDQIKLFNSEAFYDVIKQHGNVVQIICGHIHRTIAGSHKGIPFFIFKSTTGQMPMLFDTMNFHMECDEPAAYGLLDLSSEGIIINTEDFGLTDLDAIKANL